VKLGALLRPREPRHLRATLACGLVLLLVYLVLSRILPWSPKRGAGLAFGFLAAALFAFAMSYPARRPRAWPLPNARAWLQAHLYLGALALWATLIHAGFAWPAGGLSLWLLLLASWTTATGLIGVALQKWIPAALAEGLRVEALLPRIPELVEKNLAEADALAATASDVLERFYRTEVRGTLVALAPSWSYLVDVRSGREHGLERFRRMAPFVAVEERPLLDSLESLYVEKLELDAHFTLQRLLRGWLLLHVPAAGVMMGLIALHALTWILY
jgi:hypothetical protein